MNEAPSLGDIAARSPDRAAPRHDLLGAAAILMAAFIASRLTGLLREVAVTAQFGIGRELDVYVAAIRIPDFLFQIVAGGAVASAFIPVFKAYVTRDDERGLAEAWNLVSTLFNLAIVFLSPLIVLLIALAPTIMTYFHFEPEYQAMAADLARILLVSPLFFTIGCFITSVLNSFQRFFLAALAPVCYNLGIIFGAVVLAHHFGIYGLALGATTGAALFLLVQVPGLFQVGMRYRPVLNLHHPGVRRVGKLMAPRVLGLAAVHLNVLITTTYLASSLPGAIAALNVAWQLTMLPLGIFGMAIGTAVFPSLAEQTAREQIAEMARTALNALRMVLFLTIPSALGLILLAEPIVRLLYERGRFQTASTEAVAGALQLYVIGLVGMAAIEIVTRAFYALQDTRTPVAVGFGAMVLNVALAVVLLPVLAHRGLALATGLASLVEAVVLFALASRLLPGLVSGELLQLLLKSATAGIVMAAVVYLVQSVGAPLVVVPYLGQLLLVGCSIGAGAISYLVVAWLLGLQEVRRLQERVAARVG